LSRLRRSQHRRKETSCSRDAHGATFVRQFEKVSKFQTLTDDL
jgi:hypothetical protein